MLCFISSRAGMCPWYLPKLDVHQMLGLSRIVMIIMLFLV
jgi:hypothetical protein